MSDAPARLPLYRSGMLRECWDFRGFILASVKRDFVSRYLGTNLGFFWALAQPLAMIVIYTAVFSEIMKPALPGYASPFAYSVYLCSGIVVWQLFSDLLNRSLVIFVSNATLLKKVSLPKLALPIIATLSCLASFAILLGLFFGFLLIAGLFPGVAVVAFLPLVILIVAFALGLGIFLGSINVFYRDVAQSTALVLQFWFWLTPIVYPARALPGFLTTILEWNPMWPIAQFAHAIFLDARVPNWSMLAYPALVAAVCVVLGWIAFRKLSGEIVDEL